jgi:hypothetical protein
MICYYKLLKELLSAQLANVSLDFISKDANFVRNFDFSEILLTKEKIQELKKDKQDKLI